MGDISTLRYAHIAPVAIIYTVPRALLLRLLVTDLLERSSTPSELVNSSLRAPIVIHPVIMDSVRHLCSVVIP